MDSTASPQNTTSKSQMYVLSSEVEEARTIMKKSARTANLINDYFPYVAAIPVILALWGIGLDLGSASSIIASFAAIVIGYVGVVVLSHLLVVKAFSSWATKKATETLARDRMAATIADHLNVPLDVVSHAINEMVIDRSGWAEFVHHDEVIKLKLDKKRDDFLKENIRFIKVTRRPAVSVASELIHP